MKAFLLILLVAVFTGVSRAEEPYQHHASGISLPSEIAGAKRGDIRPYGSEGGKGEAIAYQAEGIEITVFIRPVGEEKVTSALIVDQSLAAAKELEKRGMYSGVKPFALADRGAAPGWCHAGFQATVGGQPMTSSIYATVKGAFVVKIRITAERPPQASIDAFMAKMQQLVAEARPGK